MVSKRREKVFYIRVNDIFDELSEEKKRLNEELMFANNCLKVLNEFKSLLNKICVKFEKTIDFEDKQELNRLENEFNSVIKSREETIKTDDENRDIVREIDENSNELNEDLSEDKEVSNETNVRRSGRTDRKVYAIPVKRKPKPKTETKPKPKPKVTEIPEPEEQPNSMLLLKRNNFDAKTQSYVCPNPYCDKSFPTHRILYIHFHKCHFSQRSFSCDHQNCNKSFKTRGQLKTHFLVHSDDRPFLCPFEGCEYRCKQKHVLDQHLVTHSEVRSYKCSECEKTFRSKCSFFGHMKLHSTRPAYKCRFEGCHQTFSKSYHLIKHKAIEHNLTKNFSCDWPGCGFETTHSTKFKYHKALHTGRKDFMCEWPGCGKRFRTCNMRYRHKLIHQNEKRYSCDWPGCEYRANICDQVNQHKKWNHK